MIAYGFLLMMMAMPFTRIAQDWFPKNRKAWEALLGFVLMVGYGLVVSGCFVWLKANLP